MNERRQGFRRRMAKNRAVSPVVATLILILIAVAAAAALYLWLVGWQGGITKSIGTTPPQATLYIGGSTSAYPFDQLAVTQFEQNETDVAVNDQQGGSGAGLLAVCSGAVNLGVASFPVSPADLVNSYGCSASVEGTAVVTTEAYDAVDVIVPQANPHGLLSINYDTLALVYEDASVVAKGVPTLITLTEDNGTAIPATIPGATGLTGTSPAGSIAWDQIPAAVGAATLSISIGGATAVPITEGIDTAGIAAGTPCGPSKTVQTDICDTGGATPTSGTPCGFLVCAGGSTGALATASVQTVARSDASGTTQSFEARLIDATSSTKFGTVATLSGDTTGFNGCGSNNYISDCGYVATQTGNGNPGVIADVAAGSNTIGYASDGLARAAGSGVGLVPFLGVGQTNNSYASADPTWYGGILPTTGSSGTIALGIKASTTSADYYTGYLGWRPFDIVSLTPLAGTALAFVNFVTNPGVNPNLATESQEVSIYSV